MKKILSMLIISIFLISPILAQCEQKVDKMTGDTITTTKRAFAFQRGFSGANIYFKKIENNFTNYYLYFGYSTSGLESIVVGTDCPLMLKFSNDSVISIYPTEIEVANHTSGQYGSSTSIDIVYKINADIMQLFKTYNLVLVRFYTTEVYIEGETKGKQQIKFKENANCLCK